MFFAVFSSIFGLSLIVLRLWPLLGDTDSSGDLRGKAGPESQAPIPASSKANLVPQADAADRSLSDSIQGGSLLPRNETVSLIIPARNEEQNLPRILQSLRPVQRWIELSGFHLEVIVVDDQSTDRTREVTTEFAQNFPVLNLQLVCGAVKPEGWAGKNWACHQGYLLSKGKYIAFTDADTEHLAIGWEVALRRLRDENLDLMSAVPYHICERFWEKALGPFQVLILLSTAAFSRPVPRRLFAIGQFLLFKRESYDLQKGHEAIRATLADDLELARHCLNRGGRYAVEGRTTVFRVQMYSSLEGFLNGWRRIFRLGFKHASPLAALEIYFVIAALTANMRLWYAPIFCQLCALSSLFLLWRVQKRFGDFSVWGIFFWPFGVLMFIGISAAALYDKFASKPFEWRGREYSA